MPIPKKLPETLTPRQPEEGEEQILVENEADILVNENEGVEDKDQEGEDTIESLRKKLLSRKQSMNNLKGEYNRLKVRYDKQQMNYSDVSRQFRIFLSVVTGLVSRGMFDPATLKNAPGSEVNLMKHAAGLAEVANAAAKDKRF